MKPAHSDHARTAQWQMWAGWFTAAATLVARLITVVLPLTRGRIDEVDFGLALFKSIVLIVVVWFYPHHRWPAYLMLSLWPFGFIMARTLAHAPPSVMAVGLLIGVGSFLGALGVSWLHSLRAAEGPVAPAVKTR